MKTAQNRPVFLGGRWAAFHAHIYGGRSAAALVRCKEGPHEPPNEKAAWISQAASGKCVVLTLPVWIIL